MCATVPARVNGTPRNAENAPKARVQKLDGQVVDRPLGGIPTPTGGSVAAAAAAAAAVDAPLP